MKTFTDLDSKEVQKRLMEKIRLWAEERPIDKVIWFMSHAAYRQFLVNEQDHVSNVFFINLNEIAVLRTRAFNEAQLCIMSHSNGEHWIVFKQPYGEGMLPEEYSVVLNAFIDLGITNIFAFIEAVGQKQELGQLYRVGTYHNKHFYKMQLAESQVSNLELNLTNNFPSDAVSVFGFEGCMLPTKIE